MHEEDNYITDESSINDDSKKDEDGLDDVISNSVTLYIVFLFEAIGLKHPS